MKNSSKFEEKWGTWNSCPPGTVRLAMALDRTFLVCMEVPNKYYGWKNSLLGCSLLGNNSYSLGKVYDWNLMGRWINWSFFISFTWDFPFTYHFCLPWKSNSPGFSVLHFPTVACNEKTLNSILNLQLYFKCFGETVWCDTLVTNYESTQNESPHDESTLKCFGNFISRKMQRKGTWDQTRQNNFGS